MSGPAPVVGPRCDRRRPQARAGLPLPHGTAGRVVQGPAAGLQLPQGTRRRGAEGRRPGPRASGRTGTGSGSGASCSSCSASSCCPSAGSQLKRAGTRRSTRRWWRPSWPSSRPEPGAGQHGSPAQRPRCNWPGRRQLAPGSRRPGFCAAQIFPLPADGLNATQQSASTSRAARVPEASAPCTEPVAR
jgi:hypothetical protein